MAKILIVVPVIAQEGISSVVIPQINEFVRRGIDVTLVVLSKVEFLNQKLDLPPAKIMELGSLETFLSVKAVLKSYSLVIQLINILKQLQVEVVIAHAPYAHFIMRLAKLSSNRQKLNFRLLQYFHSPQYKLFPNSTLSRKVFNSIMAKLAAETDDVHISVSESVKEDIKLNLVRVKEHVVVYNSAPPLEVAMINTDSVKVDNYFAGAAYKVVLPGRLSENKGQLFFIEVFKRFVKQNLLGHEKVSLLIVGDGELDKEIQNEIIKSGMQAYVLLHKGVKLEFLLNLMSKSDLVVVPSFLEGLGMVVLEALQVKSAVLASDTLGINEVITHRETGYLFKTGDKEDCLKKLQYIYDNRNAKLIDHTKLDNLLLTKFSFEAHIRQLLKIIESQ